MPRDPSSTKVQGVATNGRLEGSIRDVLSEEVELVLLLPDEDRIKEINQSSDQFDFNFSPVRLNRFEGIGGRDQHNWMERNRSHPIPSHPIPPHPSPKQKASTCGHHSYPLYVARVHRVYGSRSSEMGDLKDTPIMELSTQSFYSLLANTSDSFKSQADVSTGCTVAATLRQPNHLPPPKAR
ncbi:hypothetical protein C4D60_Mb05t00300 [Musa balbisiana]|uniref:Uncharacterized protein n=1 Tax=Musa balbisiana TaxID=52838 RepID=A0A4S8JSN8_MUSBA|nr:hypothetical protein C4D60_Mb05t00300 [Musa balbisiana]